MGAEDDIPPWGSGVLQGGECGHEESLPWTMPFDPSASHEEIEREAVTIAETDYKVRLL